MFWSTPPQVAHDHPPHPVQHLLHGIGAVWLPLLAAIATALHPLRTLLPLADRITLAIRRLQRARARIIVLLTRIAEGTWQDPRPRTSMPRKGQGTPMPYLPRRRAWLAGVTDHHVRAHASQLTHLLSDPATLHALASAPPQARAALARALRGPARLLGLDLPNSLQFAGPPRPPRVRPPRPPRPEPRWGKYTPAQARRYRPGPITGPLGATPPRRHAPRT